MIKADKEQVEQHFRLRMLQIREKELDYYILNSQSIAQISALLVGCSWSALVETSGGKGEVDLNGDLLNEAGDPIAHQLIWSIEGDAAWHVWSELAYPILVTINACLCTCTLWGCTVLAMLAPRLALHGSPENFYSCVDHIEIEYNFVILLFGLSILTFVLTATVWAGACTHLHQAFFSHWPIFTYRCHTPFFAYVTGILYVSPASFTCTRRQSSQCSSSR